MLIDAQPSAIIENVSDSLKKRLWWSMLLRDRSLCIGLRRRPQITSINIHGCRECLTEDDFEDEMKHSPFYNYEDKQHLLAALREQCNLAVLLTDLVSLIFSPRVPLTMSSTTTEEFSAMTSAIGNINKSLIQWEAQAQHPPNPSASLKAHDPCAALKNLTFMYYQ